MSLCGCLVSLCGLCFSFCSNFSSLCCLVSLCLSLCGLCCCFVSLCGLLMSWCCCIESLCGRFVSLWSHFKSLCGRLMSWCCCIVYIPVVWWCAGVTPSVNHPWIHLVSFVITKILLHLYLNVLICNQMLSLVYSDSSWKYLTSLLSHISYLFFYFHLLSIKVQHAACCFYTYFMAQQINLNKWCQGVGSPFSWQTVRLNLCHMLGVFLRS